MKKTIIKKISHNRSVVLSMKGFLKSNNLIDKITLYGEG